MIPTRTRHALLRCTAAIALALILTHGSFVHAKTVSIEHQSLQLLGNLELAADKTLADGLALIVHGTLAHGGMELIAALQQLLGERGVSSLAINLSLGQSARQGMYDCAQPHSHRHHDAVEEIASWMSWLSAQKTGDVLLIGHSRGGNQVARFALAHAKQLRALALIAPATRDNTRSAAAYEQNFGRPLDEVIDQARAADGEQWLDDIGFLYCGPSRVTAAAFLSYYLDDALHDTPSLLPRLSMPTLVIAGGSDQTVPDVAPRSQPHVDDNTHLLVIEDADHFFRDLYAEDLADALAEFAQQQLR